MTYRDSRDGGLTRVWIGRKRERVLRALIPPRTLTAGAIAGAAHASLLTVQFVLRHLARAGWVRVDDSVILPVYELTYDGEVGLAVLLAPRA